MFSSKCLVSKKGPLGAIWVAAYFFKKLKKSQIFETDIASSVDNILQDQLEILAYRVLAYLLLGVVRIYSKKVEYLSDDCEEVLKKINEFVVREKNKAKKEALRASCFSITRPVTFDLDAFDLEILEDTSRDNVVPREEITLKDVAWKNTGLMRYSLERFAALDDDFLMDYSPTEESLSCQLMDFETEAGTSHGIWNLKASREKLQCDKSFNEEVSQLKRVSEFEEEPPKLVKGYNKNDRGQAEVPDIAVLEKCMDQAASKQKCNARVLSEERENPQNEAEEDLLGSRKPLAEDQTNREEMKGPDPSPSDHELSKAMEEDLVKILEALAEVANVAGSENHMESEASWEKGNDRFSLEEGLNLHIATEEECLSPLANVAGSENHMESEASWEKGNDRFSLEEGLNLHIATEEECLSPLGEDQADEEQTNEENLKDKDLVHSENEVHQVMEEDCNLETSVEKLQAEKFPPMSLEESSSLVRPSAAKVKTGTEQVNFPATMTSEVGKLQLTAEDHPLSVTLAATPRIRSRGASGTSTQHFSPIQTPATKERARFSRKRKCFFDEMIVFPNNMVRQWINDASDLVSERRAGGRIALAARKTRWTFNLPQSFSEASIPCTSELKSLYSEKRLRVLESVKIVKPPENVDVSEPPPPVGQSFVQAENSRVAVQIHDPPDNLNVSEPPLFDGSKDQAGIAPQTPVRHSPPLAWGEQTEIAPQTPVLLSKSVRPFESPENLRCDHLDDIEPTNVDLRESAEGLSKIESVGKEPSLSKDEDLDLNPVSEEKCDDLDALEPSNMDPSESSGRLSLIESVEKEPSVSHDEDLDLNLIACFCHVRYTYRTLLLADGWSKRTRMVAKCLQKGFLNHRKRGKEEKLNLSKLLGGRTKKESARLFYEILVLKTKGLVDVRQDTAFGDILVLKASQWDQTY
ncbi:hypothetical protein CCACVL1_02164 [Corchorus capsularis]|uniref:Sister chromatid cohesion 1 protein 2 n=1 Tax=Corchorus capsularis TaxID=210143 RepID=A0A1R3KBE6_COCAP|nr:hypothetical protein CCACVL1_02164 [Corchorus capsularis]